MHLILTRFSNIVTARPYVTIGVILALTVLFAAGNALRVAPAETEDFLPPGSEIGDAIQETEDLFGDAGEVSIVTIIFYGDAITPDGLIQMDDLLDQIGAESAIQELLTPANPITAPTHLIGAALQVDSFETVTTEDIATALSIPEIGGFIDALTGLNADGTPITISIVRLIDTRDDQIREVERLIQELALQSTGPLQVSSSSFAVIEDEYLEAAETALLPLIALTMLLVAALVLLFLRTLTDLMLTFTGLLLSLIWVVGAEGWFGPNGLGLIGPPSSLTSMVPIVVVSLTVDYAIQSVSHYREQRDAGLPVVVAVRDGLTHVTLPLVLASVTTIVSLLAGLFSPIGAIGDFGVVAALGIGLSLIVMLTLLPAGRAIIDRRREARGTLKSVPLVANALPGIGKGAEILGKSVSRNPVPYIIVIVLVTIGLGYSATKTETEFSILDLLPRSGDVYTDIRNLERAFGGSTEMVSVLIEAEATETRTLLNLQDLRTAFEDEQLRPQIVAGPIQSSYESLLNDWTNDSGEAGDKYDPELEAMMREASVDLQLDPILMQQALDRLGQLDPTLGQVIVNNRDGIDSMLLQFPIYTVDPKLTEQLQSDIEALWFGDDEAIVATSDSIINIEVTEAITDGQTTSIVATIGIALGFLAIFFWVTLRQPILSLIAVGPIVLVLIWVLGTMAILGIPYSLVTSIITALSIGIGVDYTIHVIHRYREEFAKSRNPEQAAVRTLMMTGSALLGSALTTALGFGVLMFAPMQGTAHFGITASITILYSLIVAIVVIPPAMTVWGAYQNMRLRSTISRMWDELDVAIDDVHQRYENQNQ